MLKRRSALLEATPSEARTPSEAQTPFPARLLLLGTPHAEVDGQVVTFSHRKPLALLAYLAVTRRIQSRETLATLLWPEHETSRAYAYLRNALWQLSKTPLAPWIVVEHDDVTLAEDLWVDVPQLEIRLAAIRAHAHAPEALCAECVSHLVEVVSLYRGDFLAGFTLPDSADFEEWQFFQAEHLQQGAAYAMATLTRHHSTQGNLNAALAAARSWSALDVLNEPAQRALMMLYAQTGQRSAALRQYDTLLRNLRAARLEPSPETVTLYRRIRSGEIEERVPQAAPETSPGVHAPGPRHDLPAQTTAFVGREDELAELYDLLALPECRLVTVTGPGGVGKTRLALQAAHEQIKAFPDGVVFVPLAPVRTPESMILSIADALGTAFYPQTSISPQAQLLAYLGQRKILLVLDNLEQLLEHVGVLIEILAATPHTKLLVTSRERLNVRGEWVVELEGLPYPSGTGAGVDAFDAIVLFIETAQRISASFEPDDAELAAIAHISKLVEGMPLGIELAAAWTRMLSCAEIAEEMEASLDFLTMTLRDLPEHHQSLRAVFARSWGLLSEAERRSFRALAVFRGGFTREAAQMVAGADLQMLASLMDKSLLRRTAEGRYEILEVLRQYAEEQLHAIPGEAEGIRSRHARYYLRLLRRVEEPLKGCRQHGPAISQRSALDSIQRDFSNIRLGWRWATETCELEAISLAAMGLALFCEMRSRFREGEAMFGQAMDAVQTLHDEAQSGLLGLLLAIQGHLLSRYGHIRDGCKMMERAHATLASAEESPALALVEVLSAYIGPELSPEERRGRLENSLRIYRALEDTWGVALAQEALGEHYNQVQDYISAEAMLRQSLALRRSTGDVWGTAMTLHALGHAEAALGRSSEAMRDFDESIALREQLGDIRGIAICQTLKAHWLTQQGELAAAQELHQQTVQTYQAIGDVSAMTSAQAAVQMLAHELGDLDRAQTDDVNP